MIPIFHIIKSNIKFTIALVVLSICLFFTYQNIFIPPKAEMVSDKEFPSRVADWHSEDVKYDSELLSVLATDKTIYKTFRNGSSAPRITLFIAYYKSLEKADFSHSPLVCLTGQGWRIEKSSKKEIYFDRSPADDIEVNHIIQRKLDTTMISVFWYQSANHAFANRGIQKLNLFFDRLIGNSEKNAFVRLTAVVPPDKSVDETAANLDSFVRYLYPEIQ